MHGWQVTFPGGKTGVMAFLAEWGALADGRRIWASFSWEIGDQTWSLITRRILPHPLIGNITIHQSCITRLEAGENCAVID